MNMSIPSTRKAPLRVIVVGMGVRSMIYSSVALTNPELLQIVGVVDIDPKRREYAKLTFGLEDEQCFNTVDELVAVPKYADAVINGTMDRLHVRTSIPLLRHGYDMLLEKPFALNEEEAEILLQCAKETGRTVMVCHVLRYAPFYQRIKQVINSGEIGHVINIHMAAQVNYFHESVSFVRGKYASAEICGSGMLLTKCSHDLDLMAWLMGDNHPQRISSVGSMYQFVPEHAPQGAGNHCLNNCPVERDCPYSARRLYIENPQRWADNVWYDSNCAPPETDEEKETLLSRADNPYSRCVYRCETDIVDHQSVLLHFKDGATGTFSMTGGASVSARSIHIIGTKGELYGTFESGRFTISHIAPGAPTGRVQHMIDISASQEGCHHGGGDREVVLDFIAYLRGEPTSPGKTLLEDSVYGHRIVFLAEKSRIANGAIQEW
ncbi:MAG: Gfo/Idh/MocA family oxidoreductase [Akkermansia sp.]|nr:Gfo/Idh/MocA family oxidoreductase [Akkermansia sp.]MBR5875836.1 Gfo/Idh/MocA family oxidoreductase [Akkermansia sp.]